MRLFQGVNCNGNSWRQINTVQWHTIPQNAENRFSEYTHFDDNLVTLGFFSETKDDKEEVVIVTKFKQAQISEIQKSRLFVNFSITFVKL